VNNAENDIEDIVHTALSKNAEKNAGKTIRKAMDCPIFP